MNAPIRHTPDHSGHGHSPGHACCGSGPKSVQPETSPDGKLKDPVCGMWVDPDRTQHRAEHGGLPYFFCSAGCRTKFLADPERYLSSTGALSTPAPVIEGAEYTCPMHPEIRQIGPGPCPICGMALEPVMVTAEAPPTMS